VKPLVVTAESTSRHLCECGRRVSSRQPGWRRHYAPPVDHNLCPQCWQAETDRNRVRARERTDAPSVNKDGTAFFYALKAKRTS
jgi:hypothetical protein